MTSSLAQTPPSATDPTLTLLQYGVLGLVLLALLVGWLWARPAVQQILRDKERAERQRDEAVAQLDERVLPVVAELTQAIRSLQPVLEEVLRRLPDDRRRSG